MDACTLLGTLETLRADVEREGNGLFESWKPYINREDFLVSGQNLAHYLALWQRDLRNLQTDLMPWGLSSLGRSESRVLENLDAVIDTLRSVCRCEPRPTPDNEQFFAGSQRLEANTATILGAAPTNRRVRIMVTFPTEAATDYAFVKSLLESGMNCARINCAHDDAATWQAMIDHIHQAEAETGLQCKVLMDLAGPKIRTHRLGFSKKHRFVIGDVILITHGKPHESNQYPYQLSCTLPIVLSQAKWVNQCGLMMAKSARSSQRSSPKDW